ncbi:hypothetical protein KC19_VG004800 [Ceratodon purpureus]|uniref:Uncharacterized protein n=1 Tax=Ceratodon purpureus TaxID=3225 RepID=A0A8T0HKL7_CERPU|nr:hypothetical protein KC19_VG004800 [Ceratodon purpureus]
MDTLMLRRRIRNRRFTQDCLREKLYHLVDTTEIISSTISSPEVKTCNCCPRIKTFTSTATQEIQAWKEVNYHTLLQMLMTLFSRW